MAVLVCGGAGYIGSHCVYELIDRGESVVVVDNLSTGFKSLVHKEAIFYDGDIRDYEFLYRVFSKEKIDSVIHFAASSLVGESMIKPLDYFDNNVYGTEILLKVMVAHNVEKIVFSSTAAVYGEPENIPIVETDKTSPTNPYGETKLAVEKMMKWSDLAYGIKYVSLRYFNVAGAHPSGDIGERHNPETHIIPLVLQVPLGIREEISIFGEDYDTRDGSCVRDYIHVMDLIDAHLLALKHLRAGKESEIFNLGNGKGFSVKEIIDTSEEVTGRDIKRVVADRRNGDPAILIASSEKIKQNLGWKPRHVEIKDIIESAWNFYKRSISE